MDVFYSKVVAFTCGKDDGACARLVDFQICCVCVNGMVVGEPLECKNFERAISGQYIYAMSLIVKWVSSITPTIWFPSFAVMYSEAATKEYVQGLPIITTPSYATILLLSFL